MDNTQIYDVLSKSRKSRNTFRGCFPADCIPPLPPEHRANYPFGIVINTDRELDRYGVPLPGRHWVALWVESPIRAEYYDSLGKWPAIPSHNIR